MKRFENAVFVDRNAKARYCCCCVLLKSVNTRKKQLQNEFQFLHEVNTKGKDCVRDLIK